MADISNIYQLLDDESLYLFLLKNPQYNPYASYPGGEIQANWSSYTNQVVSTMSLNYNFADVYFCNHVGVRYGNRDYTAIPCEISDLTYTTNAESSPTLTIGDSNGAIGSLLSRSRGIEGCELQIQKVKRRALDDGSTPNYLFRQSPEIFKVANISSRTSKAISFKLKSRVTLKDRIPGRTLTENCSWKQYRGAGCEYYGLAMYDENNNPTNDASRDICQLTPKACKLRGNYQNFGGIVSIDTY